MRSSLKVAVGGFTSARSHVPMAILTAVALLLVMALATPAVSQQSGPGEFTPDQLEAFAAASLRVEELNAKWMPRLSEAESAEDNAAIQQQAMGEMGDAVRDEGLTVQEYNEIFDAAQRDPRVMQVVEQFRQEMQQ